MFSFISDDKPEFQPENNQHRRLKIHIWSADSEPHIFKSYTVTGSWLAIRNKFIFLFVCSTRRSSRKLFQINIVQFLVVKEFWRG